MRRKHGVAGPDGSRDAVRPCCMRSQTVEGIDAFEPVAKNLLHTLQDRNVDIPGISRGDQLWGGNHADHVILRRPVGS